MVMISCPSIAGASIRWLGYAAWAARRQSQHYHRSRILTDGINPAQLTFFCLYRREDGRVVGVRRGGTPAYTTRVKTRTLEKKSTGEHFFSTGIAPPFVKEA
jgi:hypothetical protein